LKTFNSITEVHSEIIQIWETAWLKQPSQKAPWIIQFDDQAKAISMRQRMYAARKKLLELNYPNAANFNRLEVSTSQKDGSIAIYLPSWITAVRQALVEAGVEPIIDTAPEIPPVEPESQMAETLLQLFPAPTQGERNE